MSNIYFIDSRVQFDQALLSALPADAIWHLIGPDEDGVAQIRAALTGVTGLDSIQIVSHGDVGTLYLGSTVLDANNLMAYADALLAIGSSLNASGDILLYGCQVGANGVGQQFIDQLAQLTGADVAASTNTTGSGGDWILEASSGTVEAASLSGPATLGALGTITGTNGDDTLTGGAGNDTLIGGLGNDTIDGGSGYNTYRIQGTIDAFYWSFNANGQMLVTDTVTDGVDSNDGSNQGVDTLKNIQVLEFVNAGGTVSTTFQVDDYSNAADSGNTQIQYGVWVNGRANYYGDTDWFKLDTVAGTKVVLTGGSNNGGRLTTNSGNGYSLFDADGYVSTWNKPTFTATTNGTFDIHYWTDGISSTTPGASKGYSFILRRELDGTDAADNLVAGTSYEHLVGGLGNDTLTGSDRSDYLSGGDGNDTLIGGKGNDDLDGGAGIANVAVFAGNKADYTATWMGANLSLRVADQVAGRDGIDNLTNVQILRFADGDVVLDAESNTPTQTVSLLGQTMAGSLPVDTNGQWLDKDYFRVKFGADISTSTALRISFTAPTSTGTYYNGYIQFVFQAQDASDVLTFNRLDANGTISTFQAWTYPGYTQSWIVSPQYWGSNSEFLSMVQWADLKVEGSANNSAGMPLGTLAGYTIKVDRVLYGTTAADTLVGDGLSGYIDARDGNDSVTGSSINEEIIGGVGDDTLDGGVGNDILRDGIGNNILRGGEGDDLIDVSASSAPTANVDGGAGIDTLMIASGTNWSGLTVSGVEVLDGKGGSTILTPDQVRAKGFTTAQNITFHIDPNLSTGGTLDASGLSGNFSLRGTSAGDTLTGNDQANTIHLQSDVYSIVVWRSGRGGQTQTNGSQIFNGIDAANRTYFITGTIDGGTGSDTFKLDFSDPWWRHAWGGYVWESQYQYNSTTSWTVDVSNVALTDIESLVVTGSSGYSRSMPTEIRLSTSQIAEFTSTSGLPALAIVGGGSIDLAHLSAIGITTWRIGDGADYSLTGTGLGDTVTVGSGKITLNLGDGNDEIIIDSKPLVTDVLDGGAGTDTLTIRGTDVDLSGATLSNIEAIKVSSQSLSMTDTQWQALGGIVSRVAGANTGYILSVTTPGTTTLAADSPYVGLTGSSGDDRLIGNAGDNILVGGVGSDVLTGNAGKDRLVTGDGVDTLSGGDGDDTLVVTGKTTVRDQLSGDAGTDTLQVSDGQDFTAATLSGLEILKGSGTVTMSAAQLASFSEISGVTVQVSGTGASFTLNPSTQLTNGARIYLPDVDTTVTASTGIVGSRGDDTITGSSAANFIYGGRGGDVIDGGAGNDTLVGGSGADTLIGGVGDDRFDVLSTEFSGGVLYADRISGGDGNDTLNVALNGTYVLAPGAVSGVENFVASSWGSVYLSADAFKQFASFNSYGSVYLKSTAAKDLDLSTLGEGVNTVHLMGAFGTVDASDQTHSIAFEAMARGGYDYLVDSQYIEHRGGSFESILTGSGADKIYVGKDYSGRQGPDKLSFTANLGAGDDRLEISYVKTFNGTVDGGTGTDTLYLNNNTLIDISGASLSNVENVSYGTATLVVTQNQLDTLSFDGTGAKLTKVGSAIVGTTGNDSYTGDGTGSFQGGKGDDSINNVNTVVFTGNYADYDFTRSGNTLTVQQARGSMNDGTDTVTGVMNLKFADTTLKIDDAPDGDYYNQYINNATLWASLTHAEYSKAVSGKKDYTSDTDLFSTTLAPNSPLAIDASTLNGSSWFMSFWDTTSGQQLQFKSLVHGGINYGWNSWMYASQKWLPGFNTSEGFNAYEGGDIVIRMNVDGAIQDYSFTLNFLDDYAGSIDTLGQMNAQNGVVKGYIGEIADADWIRTDLIAGTKYEFHLNGVSSGGGTLVDPKLQLMDSAGRLIESGIDLAVNTVGNDDALIFRPTVSGSYYLAVTDVAKINTGSWTLTQQSLDTIAGNTSTTERIDWSGANTFTVNSEINVLTDHDWFKVWLDNGITYNFRALGASNGGTLADPQVSIRSATGILLAQDDNSGGGTDAKLVYSAPDSGWYYLDVGASGNASKGTYILKGSTLADDFSNDVFTTGIVQAGTPLQGLVSYIGDSDWVKAGLSRGVTYVIDLVGDISDTAQLDPLRDPLLTIRDANGNFIARFDDFGGTLNSRAYFTPTADGLYYLEAKSAFKYDIGAWKLSVTQAPLDDFGATMDATAAALTLGTAQAGEIGLPGDRDVFKVSLETGKVYQVSVGGLAGHAGTLVDPYLHIFDSAGHLVDFDNNGGAGNDAQMYFAPGATGTYYIEASSNNDHGMGSYSVNVVQRDFPADDVPNNLSTNVFLNPGDSFSGNLLTHNDQDWFGINLNGGKDYVFRLQASHSGNGSLADPVLEIRAADGTLLKSVDNMLTSNEPATAFTPDANGTYYLVVKAADGQTDTGTYTLVTRAPDDYSNTKPGAATIALDQTLDGAIQWSDGTFGVRAYDSVGLATDIDEDWFQFSATQGQVLSVQVKIATGSALSRPMVEVVDGQGRSLAVGDGLETTNGLAVATFKATDAGAYYARVIDGAGATGAYQISLAAGDASDEDASGAVAMNFVTAGAIVQAENTARIGLAGDTDTFAVGLQQGHSYRIETLAVRDGTHAPLPSAHLGLTWQGNPVDVASEVGSPSFFDSTVFTAEASGTMTINVAPLETTQTGQYKVRVVDLGTSQADDRPGTAADYVDATDGVLAINENTAGRIDSATDVDLFAINLTAGNLYDFSIKSYADGLGTLAQAELRLLDIDGNLVTSGTFDSVTGRTQLPVSVFADGRYFLAVSAAELAGNTGTYVLDTRLRGSDESTDDLSADTRSGLSAGPGHPATGTINYSTDHDWIKTTLEAGKVYVLDVLANGDGAGGTLKDATLRLLDAQGRELAFDDNSGAALDAHIQFTATESGEYYLDVGSNGGETGTYTVRVRELYSGEADPLKSAQWYLAAAGLDKLYDQLTGAGVTVGVVDDGIDTSHPDLQNQLNFALAYDTQFNTQDGMPKYPVLVGSPDNHGTMVAGIIAAEANNETGIVGVAPDAELVSTRVKWTWDQITEALGRQWQFDVSNNSWGAINPFGDNFNSTTLTFAWQALRTGVEDGRDGLGTVFVFSAGNSAGNGDNTNYHNFQNAREVIAVGAADASGAMAGFSTPGANVLVSSYGVNMITTDRHQPGWGVDPSSNYVTNFTGTSAAAPMVSGIVALMLEANPNLGYRDVQEILVYASTHPDNQDWKTNGASNFNLGGMQFNDKAGFGLVDAYSAVRLAQTWTDVSTAVNEVSASARAFGLTDAIPDGDGTTYTRSFTIDSAISVEHVELGVDLRHTRLGDLIIELTSPNGTVSTLMNRPTVNAEQPFGLSGADSGVPTHLLWDFSSVQFWGEEASGTWTVTIKDVRAEETGMLSSLSLRVYGEREDGNDTYVFTEEGFQGSAARVLSDESGIDTINAVTMQHDTYVDLGAGKLIAAEGVTYKIAEWSLIENAITGTGNDRLDGNDADNVLKGMEGNDTLTGRLGNDILVGGSGSDVAYYTGAMAEFGISWNPVTRTVTVVDNKTSNGDEGTDQLTGIERIVFGDGEINLSATVGNKAPLATSSVFDSPVFMTRGMGIDFDIPADAFSDPDGSTTSALEINISDPSGSELPSWLSYDPSTGKLTGVPPEDYQGQLQLLVTAIDEFGDSTADILTLQFGDNQAPVLAPVSELVITEDVGLINLNLAVPYDPEGTTVTIKLLDIPALGAVLDKNGNQLAAGTTLSADEFSELHFQTLQDAFGDAGYVRYQATDEDGVVSQSAIHIFIDPVNDAPRFATTSGQLTIQYPEQSTVPLDMLLPSDPESTLTTVRLIGLPEIGVVTLDSQAVNLGQVLTFDQLQRLVFTLSENVNGPIGAVTIKAIDPQGLATNWSLALEVQGDIASSNGTPGGDVLYGSIGNDTLYGMAGDDTLVGNAGNDRLLGGLGNDTLFGGRGNDVLDGSSGNDYLDGGTGNDTMSGGPGNDVYFVDSPTDFVLEVISGGAGGVDLVVTSISMTAPANVENLQATDGGFGIKLQGNALNNVLLGNELDNQLVGGAGLDTLMGGLGNDILDGGAGIDRMAGGGGDDQYVVDSRFDTIVELANEGVDSVRAFGSYTLSSNVENLTLEEGGDYSAGGNSLNNHLIGNSGNNVLAGGLGRDTLEGGLGNDIYVLSDTLDTIIDTGGIDTIRSSLSIKLEADIENAELVGFADTYAIGNGADNKLVGNLGNNILEGMGGVDTLTGGAGDDQFVVAYNGAGSAADTVTDFTSGSDLLVIDLLSFGVDAIGLGLDSSGLVSADAFVKGAGARALDTNDHFLLDTATGQFSFDSDGSGSISPIVMLNLGAGASTLTNTDLFVVI
jgi:Ca2+-binding RTX toxin-like protein